MADGFSKYRDEILQLTGFDIMEEGTTNDFKSLYNIFDGIAGAWDKLTETQQSRVSEILGGTRQLQVISSILNNWDDATNAYADAMESAGTATEAQSTYMESLNAKIEQFNTSVQELYYDFLNSDLVAGVVDFGTECIQTIDNIIDSLGSLSTAIIAIGAVSGLSSIFKGLTGMGEAGSFMAAFNGTALDKYVSGIGLVFETIGEGFTGVITQSKTFSSALSDIGVAFSTWFSTNPFGVILTAVAAVAAGVAIYKNFFEETTEDIIKAGEEAQSAIADINSNYESTAEAVGNIDVEKYTGYMQEVNSRTNENQGLTNEEYQEYLDISNQLGELFPSLVSGFDSQGNAMLNLSSDADEASDSLNTLLNQERDLANYKIAEQLDDVAKGMVAENSELEKQIQEYTELAEISQRALGYSSTLNEGKLPDFFSQQEIDADEYIARFEIVADSADEVDNAVSKFREAVDKAGLNGFLDETFYTTSEDLAEGIYRQGYQLLNLTEDQIEKLNIAYRNALEAGDMSDYLDLTEAESNLKVAEARQKELWSEIAPSLQAYVSSLGDFLTLSEDEDMQNVLIDGINSMIGNFDITNLDAEGLEEFQSDVKGWVSDNFVQPIFDAATEGKDDVVQAYADLFTIDTSKMTMTEAYEAINAAVETIFPDDLEAQREMKILLGFEVEVEDENGEASTEYIWEQETALIAERLGLSQETLNEYVSDWDLGDIEVAYNLVLSNSSIDSFGKLEKEVQKQTEEIGTVATFNELLFTDEGEATQFSEDIDTFQSGVDDINSALDSLRNGEEVNIMDMIQTYGVSGNLETLEEELTQLNVDNVREFVDNFNEQMAKISDSTELENAKNALADMVSAVDLSGIDFSNLSKLESQIITNAIPTEGAMSYYINDLQKTIEQVMSTYGLNDENLEAIYRVSLMVDSTEFEDWENALASQGVKVLVHPEVEEMEAFAGTLDNEVAEWFASLSEEDRELVYNISIRSDDTTLWRLDQWQMELNAMKTSAMTSSESIQAFYDVMNDTGTGNFSEQINDYIDEFQNLQDILSKIDLGELSEEDKLSLVLDYPELTGYADDTDALRQAIQDLMDTANQGMSDAFEDQIRALGGESTEAGQQLLALQEILEGLQNVTASGFDIDDEISKFNNLYSAMEESVSATGLTSDSIANIEAMYSGLEGYDASVLFEKTANGIHLNTTALRGLEAEYEASKKLSLDETLIDLKEQYNEATAATKGLAEGTQAYNDALAARGLSTPDSILSQIQDVQTLAAQYEGLTSSYNKWVLAQSSGEEGDMYDNVANSLESINELYESGLTGTNAFRSAVQMMTDTDMSTASQEELNEVYESGYATMQRYFTEGSEGCLNFLNDVQSLNSEWASVDEEGNWTIDFGIGNDEEIAAAISGMEGLQMSTEEVQMVMRKLSDYGFDIQLDSAYTSIDEIKTKAEEAEESVRALGAEPVELEIDPYMDVSDADAVDDAIQTIQDQIEEINNSDIDLDVKTAQIDYLQSQLDLLIARKLEAEEPAFMSLSSTDVDSTLSSALTLFQQYEQAVQQEETLRLSGDTEGLDEAQGKVDGLLEEISGLDNETLAAIGIDVDDTNAETRLESIRQAIENGHATFGVLADTSAATESLQQLQEEQTITTTIDFSADINSMSIEEVESTIEQIEEERPTIEAELRANLDDEEAEAALESLDTYLESLQNRDIQLKISAAVEEGNSVESLLDMKDEELAATLNIDVNNEEELEQARSMLESMAETTQADVAFTVTIDESQFEQLLNQQDGTVVYTVEDSEVQAYEAPEKEGIVTYSVQVEGDTGDVGGQTTGSTVTFSVDSSQVEAYVPEGKDAIVTFSAETSEPDGYQPADKTATVIYNINASQPNGYQPSNKTATVTYIANTSLLPTSFSTITRTVNYVATGDTGHQSLGTAHANGTAYGMWSNYRHSVGAYANGTRQNWALPQDEVALTNETGEESIVRNGQWMLLPGGAHFESLKRGDIVNKRAFIWQQVNEFYLIAEKP